jgi:general secretion pathway protein H
MNSNARSRGFTLIEVLVVTVLLLIVAGLAMVKLDDGGERATRKVAEELSIQLEAARDEAVYAGQSIAFSSDGLGYKFWLGDSSRRQWFAAPAGGELSPRTLQNNVRIVSQIVNGKERPLGDRLVFSADGMVEPFRLVLEGGTRQIAVEGDALGRVSVKEFQSDAK